MKTLKLAAAAALGASLMFAGSTAAGDVLEAHADPQMKQCEVGPDTPVDTPCADPALWRNCSDGSTVMRYAPCSNEKRCGNEIIAADLICLADSPKAKVCPGGDVGKQVPEDEECPGSEPVDQATGQASGNAQFHGCALWPAPPLPYPIDVPCRWPGVDTGPM